MRELSSDKSSRKSDVKNIGTRDITMNIRCGRVMADNIAYAKFRKNLLI